jgi:hypothetical protein
LARPSPPRPSSVVAGPLLLCMQLQMVRAKVLYEVWLRVRMKQAMTVLYGTAGDNPGCVCSCCPTCIFLGRYPEEKIPMSFSIERKSHVTTQILRSTKIKTEATHPSLSSICGSNASSSTTHYFSPHKHITAPFHTSTNLYLCSCYGECKHK